MAGYDPRRMKAQEDRIFNRTSRVMAMYLRTIDPVPPGDTDDLFAADTEPSEPGEFTKIFFRGKFEESVDEQYEAGGYIRSVKATITVPMMYRGYLSKASYIDPYIDGSRFRKVGAIAVESRLYIIQKIESVSLANLGEINI